jgi:hypothetical protein
MLLPGRVVLDGIGLGWITQPEAQTRDGLNQHGGMYPASSTGNGYLDTRDVEYDRASGEFRALLHIPENLRGMKAWVTAWARYEDQTSGPPFCVMSQILEVE